MRDIHRNPILYYLLIPVLGGLWPLLVWAVYLPSAERERDNDYSLLIEGQTQIMGILEIDPDRTKTANINRVAGEFAYTKAVDSIANMCRLPAGSYGFTAGSVITVSGKQRQDARVKLKDTSIVQAVDFLSRIQSTWVNLQCEQIELTKRKGMPDQWEVDFKFNYYY